MRLQDAQPSTYHVKVHSDTEEEGEPRCKLVDCKTGFKTGATVLDAVGHGEAQLEGGRSASFLHVVARYTDRVEFRHVLCPIQITNGSGQQPAKRLQPALYLGDVAEDISDDAHGRCRRVDVRVANHELLQDVVLDGS